MTYNFLPVAIHPEMPIARANRFIIFGYEYEAEKVSEKHGVCKIFEAFNNAHL